MDVSSPRIWGTAISQNPPNVPRRFIPTHMGNGAVLQRRREPTAVHPHAYGERLLLYFTHCKTLGSSPRIWGTVALSGTDSASQRFIPTHMGNGGAAGTSGSAPTVHPHAYGERTAERIRPADHLGSSPRIWGTEKPLGIRSTSGRFIPTHMGNGNLFRFQIISDSVHPHAYGERRTRAATTAGACGSSPRIWGTARVIRLPTVVGRFIPTHMGNGVSEYVARIQVAVHPHAYGEREKIDCPFFLVAGSSPRIWGTEFGIEK